MASQLANLLVSALGAITRPAQSTPAKPAGNDDQFARLVDTPRPEAPAAQNKTGTGSRPAANDASPKAAAETSDSAATDAATRGEDEQSTKPQSLADTLLAALAALGLSTEGLVGGETVEGDPAALKDVKDALKDLSDLLGMDLTTLMQQLATLAKGVAAEGGGADELAARLGSWLGEQMGAAGPALDANAEASIAKLMGGLGELARSVPAEPTLTSAQLKLTEPALVGKAGASEEKLDIESARLERKADAKPAVTADAGQKAQANPIHAARDNGTQDNVLNLTPAPAAQADAPAPIDTASTPRVVQTGYQTSQQQLNLPQIAFELSRQVQDGNTRFQIRLDPPELGRIDVKLDIDNRGQVHARLTVEKAETLDLMQRDQRALERALQQAGLDQSKTNLEFSLKQNPFAGDHNQQRGGSEHSVPGGGQDGQEETEVPAPAITLYRGALQASGVNIIA